MLVERFVTRAQIIRGGQSGLLLPQLGKIRRRGGHIPGGNQTVNVLSQHSVIHYVQPFCTSIFHYQHHPA
jgi:hypothetical protein